MPPRIRTDLNGLRVRLPKHAPIYLVDEGKKRHIPNPQVYNELFKDWTGVVADINIDDVTTGTPLPLTAILFKCSDDPKVSLLDGNPPNQVKRHVASPAVMEHYHFNWDHIHVWNVPLSAIGYPDGTQIRNPPNV
jgi:hypothetical protein